MPETTDGFELAREVTAAAQAVQERMLADYASLTTAEERELDDLFWDLASQAARIRTMAVGALLAEAETSVAALSKETRRARKAIRDLERVRAAIAVAGALLTLASAVATRNVAGVKSSAKTLGDLLKDPAKDLGKAVAKKARG